MNYLSLSTSPTHPKSITELFDFGKRGFFAALPSSSSGEAKRKEKLFILHPIERVPVNVEQKHVKASITRLICLIDILYTWRWLRFIRAFANRINSMNQSLQSSYQTHFRASPSLIHERVLIIWIESEEEHQLATCLIDAKCKMRLWRGLRPQLRLLHFDSTRDILWIIHDDKRLDV